MGIVSKISVHDPSKVHSVASVKVQGCSYTNNTNHDYNNQDLYCGGHTLSGTLRMTFMSEVEGSRKNHEGHEGHKGI